MSDEPTDMIENLRRQTSGVMTTVAARRERELHGIDHLERRALRGGPARDKQMNLKVTARFKARVEAFAVSRKLSSTEVMVRAFDAYAAKE